MKKNLLLLLPALFAGITTSHATITLGDWTFNYANGGAGLVVSGTTITSTGGTNSDRAMWNYFSPQTLSDGDTLAVSVTITLSNPVLNQGRGISVGLFNSNGTFQTGAVGGGGSGDMRDDDGFFQSLGTGSNTTSRIESWNGVGNTNLFLNYSGETTDLNAGLSGVGLSDTTDFDLSFSITRKGNAYDLESFSGIDSLGSVSGIAPVGATDAFSFDTLAFGVRQAGQDVTFSNISVDYISVGAVPEPSTYALLAGALTFALVIVRRRRNR
jgi:hypothetical protein